LKSIPLSFGIYARISLNYIKKQLILELSCPAIVGTAAAMTTVVVEMAAAAVN